MKLPAEGAWIWAARDAQQVTKRGACAGRCGVEDFKRSTDSWRTRAESAAVLRSEFAEMLGDGDTAANGTDRQGD